jgi:hypothetical protein
MSAIGTVESLWRYPIKSMRGEKLNEVFAGFSGVSGDRLFAFESSAGRKDFPYFTGREQCQMIRYRPRFRNPNKMASLDPADGGSLPRGGNLLSAHPTELMIDVETPDGKTIAIDDPSLIDHLLTNIDKKHQLTLRRSDKALTDCYPLSIFGVQSARKLGEETGMSVDQRRFRANIYLDLAEGFVEDKFVGRSLRIGAEVIVSILERDPRCMMITLDPETGEKEPALLKKVAQAHGGMAGVYGAVLVQGIVHKGDSVELIR